MQVPTKAIPPKAPPNAIRPFFDDDHYMPPPELLWSSSWVDYVFEKD